MVQIKPNVTESRISLGDTNEKDVLLEHGTQSEGQVGYSVFH